MNRALRQGRLLCIALLASACAIATPVRTPAPTHAPTAAVATAASTADPTTVPPTGVVTPTPLPSPAPSATPAGPRITKLGIHLLLGDHKNRWPEAVWPEHLRYARDLVGEGGYVVALVRLDDLDVERWQYFLDLCAQYRLSPILRLATWYDNTNRWWAAPIRDNEGGGYYTVAEQYRDFLDNVRFPDKRRLLIIGNEPNRGDEWENRPNGEAYAHFLTDVSRRLRENDPNVVILNAALDLYAPHTNGQPFADGYRYIDADTFIAQMLKWNKQIFETMQVWNSHAYPVGPFAEPPHVQSLRFDYLNGAAPPARSTPWTAGIVNRGINGYTWELERIRESGGPALPVMITETGWRHAEPGGSGSPDSANAVTSAAQVADYLELAFLGNRRAFALPYPQSGWTPWEEDPRVVAVIPFALNGRPWEWGHSNWLMLDEDGAVLGVYPQYERMRALRR